MSKSMQSAIALIKPMNELVDERRVAPFIQHKHGVGHQICDLQQSCFGDACEVGNIAEVPKNAPTSSELPELSDPDFCALVKSSFGKDNQPALGISLIIASCQEPIES